MDLFAQLSSEVKGQGMRLVFPEGDDARIQEAAVRLAEEALVEPVLLGNPAVIKETAEQTGRDLQLVTIIDPANYDPKLSQEMVASLVERRKGKVDEAQAEQLLLDVNYFGTMLVYMGHVDGMVSGAAHSTGETVRPALQIIKTAPGSSRISGAFVMQKGDERYVFADCAINIEPDAQTLSEIALQSAQTAEIFGIDPKVAMLSYSTKGSASGDGANKVIEATKLAQEAAPAGVEIDGELQFDAAFVPEVATSKAPDSAVAGQAKVFVFPSLEAGNISYKAVQRLGGFEAVGPILQGLAKPVSDLSRGANVEDVYKVAIITAAQVLQANK